MIAMKRHILLYLFAIASVAASARQGVSLDRGWRFYCTGESVSDNATTVDLPHTWNAADAGANRSYFRGEGNYLKDIDIPAAWNGKRVFLRFYGANSFLTLMVNGRRVAQHAGGGTAGTFEITKMLRFGARNTLWAIVNNSPRTDVMPSAGANNVYGGLFRPAELIVTSQTAISPVDNSSDGVCISARRNGEQAYKVDATVRLTALRDQTVQVGVRMLSHDGTPVAQATDRVRVTEKGGGQLTLGLDVPTPRLWDGVNDPYLYDFQVKVSVDGVGVDSLTVTSGLRETGFVQGQGFLLNGKTYPIRAVTLTQDRLGEGNALTSAQMVRDLRLVREMGANMVIFMEGTHSQEFCDMCDRAGIMAVCGIPFTGDASLPDRSFIGGEGLMANGRRQLTEVVRQYCNHPSVVMWSIFRCLSQRGDDPVPFIKELNALARKEDPTRPTVCVSNQDGEVNFITDMVIWQHRYGWTEGQASDIGVWLPYLHKTWGNLRSAVSYGAGASVRDQSDTVRRPATYSTFHPEGWQTALHEEYFRYLKDDRNLWATVVDNMFDFGAAGINRGRGPGIDDFGMVTFDRSQRKDAFYFYKANWNTTEKFVHVTDSRLTSRSRPVQTLRVFSNCEQVELTLNGTSLGTRLGVNGVFTWTDVVMPAGLNEITAHGGGQTDTAWITINHQTL